MNRGICYGVSVGPGGEGLITLEALETIEKSDVIFIPSFPKEECKAYLIAKKMINNIDSKDICPETFTMSKDISVMQKRHMEIYENVVRYLETGKNVAFLTLGDVSLYSTYLYIHELLLVNNYCSILVSGISSIQAIASKLNISLALGREELHIFPGVMDIEDKLLYSGTKIFMKTRNNLSSAISTIVDYCNANKEMEAMGVSNCGMDGEIIARNAEELENLDGYFTVIIVRRRHQV